MRFIFTVAIVLVLVSVVHATRMYTLRDGRVLQGLSHTSVAGINDDRPHEPRPRPAYLIDDGLRQIFIGKAQVAEFFPGGDGETLEVFRIRNPQVSITGRQIGTLGNYVAEPFFDEHGRRIVELADGNSTVHVIQQITEINPVFVRVQTLRSTLTANIMWDSRLATNSIDRSGLTPILLRQINPSSVFGQFSFHAA